MKRSEAAKLVYTLMATFTHREWKPENVAAYEEALGDLEAAPTGAAIQRLIRTRTFLPSVAEIRSAALDEQLGPVRSGEEAFAILRRAVNACGRSYGDNDPPPQFPDTNIQRAMGVWGSWNDACNSPEDDPGGRARFIELYESLARREREDQVSGRTLPPAHKGPEYIRAPLVRQALPAAEAKPVLNVTTPKPKPPLLEVAPRPMTAEQIEEAMKKAGRK